MEKKYTSIQSFARIKPIEKVNDEFALCKVYVQSVGKNRNYSFMSKENIQKALPTLNYAPVVGHLIPKYDDNGNVVGHYMGSHDYEITPEMELKAITVPYGVVIEDSFNFEDVEEFGRKESYLTANCYIWLGRYPELADAIYDDNTWFNQSMEISVDEFRPLEEDSNYTELLSWTYSALCLLGLSDDPSCPDANTEPAFISAQVHPVNYSLDKAEFAKTMNELKEKLNSALKEGGKSDLKFSEEARDAILTEFKITINDIDFEITEDMTEEDFRKVVEEKFGSNKQVVDNAKPDDTTKFSATYEQKREAIQNALDPAITRDENGEVVSSVSYWICDFDDKYAYVNKYTYTDSDRQEENGRLAYSFDETTVTATISGNFEKMIVKWLTVAENQQVEDSRKEFESLKEFKRTRLEADHKVAVDEVLSDFEDIAETDEYKKLSESVYSIQDLNEIKTKCYAIRGMYAPVKSEKKEFSKKNIKVEFEHPQTSTNRYGDLFSKANK